MKQKIVLIGGGGHAKVLIDLIRTTKDYEVVGILDSQINVEVQVLGVPVIGNDDLLPQLCEKGIKNACIGVGSVKDNSKRKQLYGEVKKIGFCVPSLIHPNTIISEGVQISGGVQVMAGAIIQTSGVIGENTIINTGAIVEHDCNIGKHTHICSGVVISGEVTIGDNSFIGTGATIIQGVKVGNTSIVGAGAVVIDDVPDKVTVKGIPAK